MNINIICVGKLKEKYFREAVDEYSKRLSRFVKFNIIEVPDERIPDKLSEKEAEQIKNKEGDKILAKIRSGDYVIALCIEGTELSSEEIAFKINDLTMTNSSISFIIGGSLGICDKVKQISKLRLSFGKVTLPHQLMRVVLCEQLYRAFKILGNESYHK